jgi:hypothetical protein
MADFKRYALAFAGLAAFMGAASTASAQSFSGMTCTAQASTPFQQRAEGITELAGDVFISCTGGTVTPFGSPVPTVNISIQMNTQVTSRLLDATSIATDALLLVNDPAPAIQRVCPISTITGCPSFGGGVGGATTTAQYNGAFVAAAGAVPSYTKYNAFQGQLVAANQVTFFAVPIDPPGPSAVPGVTPSLTLRITNVRDNASALGAPTGFASTSVTAVVSSSSGFSISNPVQTVGNVFKGLLPGGTGSATGFVSNTSSTSGVTSNTAVTLGLGAAAGGTVNVGTGSITFQQCISRSFSTTSMTATLAGYINFQEGFATSTKLQMPPGATTNPAVLGTPGNFQNTESGLWLNGTNTANYGTADFATRVKFTFANIQNGTTIYVPTTVLSQQTVATSTLPLGATSVFRLTSSEAGSFSAVPATTGVTGLPAGAGNAFAAITAVSGSATVVYELTGQAYTGNVSIASGTLESFSVPFLVQFSASPATNSPAVGAATVQVDYAPTSTVVTAAGSPVPRFIQTSPVTTLYTINACATVLLFPFVTNTAGFDTGLAIANTSTDPFGTKPQAGTCTLNFYGSAAPAAYTTPSIASGTVYPNLASTLAAGFQGYVIAQCGFQYGHGFAFVTDGFGGPGRGLSQGYLALVIPDTNVTSGSRSAAVITSGQSSGEQLGN